MITLTRKKNNVDFHAHILPFMDDGAANIEAAREMLSILDKQGIKRVAATSHFDFRHESVSQFVSRRDQAFEQLCASCDMSVLPKVVRGAEVYCAEGISACDLSPLCYENTNYLLIELPRLPFSSWIYTELEIIAYKQGLVPIIAHIDRYMEWYTEGNIDTLLSFDDAIFQVNNAAFQKKHVRNKIFKIIKCGYPVVFGSDAHDIDKRSPNFDLLEKELSRFKNKSAIPLIEDTLSSVII